MKRYPKLFWNIELRFAIAVIRKIFIDDFFELSIVSAAGFLSGIAVPVVCHQTMTVFIILGNRDHNYRNPLSAVTASIICIRLTLVFESLNVTSDLALIF